ncbi:MraY family glycosyltransferase [Larkinella rosea]|uniref:Glycosyltransferase family 4 protein n=1 Tax=Larkinella rosea TaxID=2025312 RepID=A0A3P1BIG4_9BACT|nr:glycosyltransferase family 4 protein [Larkinella rosea]RRB00889.1 glycosyltransferase family 4 protein [Larkinella rosea]
MNWTLYASVTAFLFGAEMLYLRLATHFNIVDTPNHRSAHSRLTVRGGGIVFWLAAFLAFVVSDFATPYFFAGLTLVALVSFVDDVQSISNRLRFLVQLVSVGLLLHETGLWQETGWWMIPGLVVACGVLNAYNFMDGINGITVFYSLITIATLLIINQFIAFFADPLLLHFSLAGLLVFAFFNARRKALCFAGDVGSVSMAFIVIFLLTSLMQKSGQLVYILLLAVYGIDSVITILYRLWLGENIFRPHKSHLFQLLVHQLKWSHLRVAGLYAVAQALINVYAVWLSHREGQIQFWGSLILLTVLTWLYCLLKNRLLWPKTSDPKTGQRRATSQVLRKLI